MCSFLTQNGFNKFFILWPYILKRFQNNENYLEILTCDFDPESILLENVLVRVEGLPGRISFIRSQHNIETGFGHECCAIHFDREQVYELSKAIKRRDLKNNAKNGTGGTTRECVL